MAVRASTLGCRLEHYRMKKMKEQHRPLTKNPQNHFCSQHWVCFMTVFCPEDRFCFSNAHCFLCAALSKPHLFENRGHNRQGSDCSVDRFMSKDEPAEPEPDNKVEISHSSIYFFLPFFSQSKCILCLSLILLPTSQPSRIKGAIGHYTDQGVEPLVHCVRLLAASFLLTGQKNGKCSQTAQNIPTYSQSLCRREH